MVPIERQQVKEGGGGGGILQLRLLLCEQKGKNKQTKKNAPTSIHAHVATLVACFWLFGSEADHRLHFHTIWTFKRS